MVLAPEAKSRDDHDRAMASANPEPLRTLSLSCWNSEKNSPEGPSHGDSRSKNRTHRETDKVENGMPYAWGDASTEKPNKLRIVICHGERKSKVASEKGMEKGDELGQRTWNLRSRTNAVGGGSRLSCPTSNIPEDAKKKEKPKRFSVALTREEIEEDFLKMTGSRPHRKPKKRSKHEQKVMEVRKSRHILNRSFVMMMLRVLNCN